MRYRDYIDIPHPSDAMERAIQTHEVINSLFSQELFEGIAQAKEDGYPGFIRSVYGQSNILGVYERDKSKDYRFEDFKDDHSRSGLLGMWDELHQISRHMGANLFPMLKQYLHKVDEQLAVEPNHSRAATKAKVEELFELVGMMKDNFLEKNTEAVDELYMNPKSYYTKLPKIDLHAPAPEPIKMDNQLYFAEGAGRYTSHIRRAGKAYRAAIAEEYAEKHDGKRPDDDMLWLAYRASAMFIAGSVGSHAQPKFQYFKILKNVVGIGTETGAVMLNLVNDIEKLGVDIDEAKLGVRKANRAMPYTEAPNYTPERHYADHLHDIQLMVALDKAATPRIDTRHRKLTRAYDDSPESTGLYSIQGRIGKPVNSMDTLNDEDLAKVAWMVMKSIDLLIEHNQHPPKRTFSFLNGYKSLTESQRIPHEAFDNFSGAVRQLHRKLELNNTEVRELQAEARDTQEKLGRMIESGNIDRSYVDATLQRALPFAKKIAAVEEFKMPHFAEIIEQTLGHEGKDTDRPGRAEGNSDESVQVTSIEQGRSVNQPRIRP